MKNQLTGLLILMFCGIISCSNENALIEQKFVGETQGTYYAVTYFSNDSINLQPEIDSLLHRFDSTASTYKPNSIISRINKNDPEVTTDSLFDIIFRKAMDVSEKSDGAFDITVGNLVNAWGFGFTDPTKLDKQKVDSLLGFAGYKNVSLKDHKVTKVDPRTVIDFNAIAQGFAVDVVASFLQSRGIENYLVDIGGEVLAKGTKPGNIKWNVGIEKPAEHADDDRKVQRIVELQDQALSTSGSYRKFYEVNGVRYSHTIDPKTGYPVSHSLLSASVLAPDCITADACATVCMVLGHDKAKAFISRQKGLEAFFIYYEDSTMKTDYTPGFAKLLKE